ncbi:MAG TPA: hypothetical protein VGP64_01015 [Polyangia bacterium]
MTRIVAIGIAWILSLALAIFTLAGIHRVLSTRSPGFMTRSATRLSRLGSSRPRARPTHVTDPTASP